VTSEQILKHLTETAAPYDELEVPSAPGVDAWFLAEPRTLGDVGHIHAGPLYVGASRDLSQRVFDTHFAAHNTGFSTLRRSLGAILKEDLGLRCRPRGKGANEAAYTHYRFDDAGEERLCAWMRENLRVAVQRLEVEDAKTRKAELIAVGCPPLSLKGWPNPDAATIRELLKVCADEARLDHHR